MAGTYHWLWVRAGAHYPDKGHPQGTEGHGERGALSPGTGAVASTAGTGFRLPGLLDLRRAFCSMSPTAGLGGRRAVSHSGASRSLTLFHCPFFQQKVLYSGEVTVPSSSRRFSIPGRWRAALSPLSWSDLDDDRAGEGGGTRGRPSALLRGPWPQDGELGRRDKTGCCLASGPRVTEIQPCPP